MMGIFFPNIAITAIRVAPGKSPMWVNNFINHPSAITTFIGGINHGQL